MAIITIEGVKVYNSPNRRSVIVNSDCIDECMEIYKRYDLDGVAITISHNYRLQNIDFLIKYPEVKHLSISEGIENLDAFYSLSKLETLILSGQNRKIDFSYFPFLVNLAADWSSKFSNLDKCSCLESLSLYKYNPKTKDCSGLSNIPWLKKLKISSSSILTLNGLGGFERLEEIVFDYCAKLETLCCLEESKETLVSLLFDHCKSIRNHSYITFFPNLREVAYNDCGTLPSIKFIEGMTSLRSFRFVGTDVVDGDLSPCLGLDYAGFTNKKHFSHTMEEIKKGSAN